LREAAFNSAEGTTKKEGKLFLNYLSTRDVEGLAWPT